MLRALKRIMEGRSEGCGDERVIKKDLQLHIFVWRRTELELLKLIKTCTLYKLVAFKISESNSGNHSAFPFENALQARH